MPGRTSADPPGERAADAAPRQRAAGGLVVLDPGHGGHDSGAVGPHGTREAEINLAVALRAHELLEESGWAAELTRWRDVYITLGQRAWQANRRGAAAFISIHCNAANGLARGIETWHFRGSRAGERLAGALQKRLAEAWKSLPDRGLKAGGFYVLRETEAPAALVEMEFLDTEGGEALLQSERGQALMAQAIADGARGFLGGEAGEALATGRGPGVLRACYRALAALGRRDEQR